MTRKAAIEIDGQRIEVEQGANLLQVARDNQFGIPGLCFHPRLSVTGSCRLCIVKIAGRPGIIPACTVKATEGMIVTAFDEELESL
ncbi:MAG: (2Fe-2S)-binding protein, partial [Dehalococcoidia bacterium]|nr:(2Fe-2S)-binding protein [Dehalococcoidia bacterium]